MLSPDILILIILILVGGFALAGGSLPRINWQATNIVMPVLALVFWH